MLVRAQERLRLAGADASWVNAADLHLTLVFLGDVSETLARTVAEGMDRVAAECSPFSFKIGDLGCFGPTSSPRVVWAGVGESKELRSLQQRVVASVEACGAVADTRPYAPHITLARLGGPRRLRELTSRMASTRSEVSGEIRVSRILLMRSQLDVLSARYTVLHAAHLIGT